MTAQPPRRRRTVLMTAGLTASAAVIAFTVSAGPTSDDDPGPGESSLAQPYDDPEPPEAA